MLLNILAASALWPVVLVIVMEHWGLYVSSRASGLCPCSHDDAVCVASSGWNLQLALQEASHLAQEVPSVKTMMKVSIFKAIEISVSAPLGRDCPK